MLNQIGTMYMYLQISQVVFNEIKFFDYFFMTSVINHAYVLFIT
jgi:hypothetical protein